MIDDVDNTRTPMIIKIIDLFFDTFSILFIAFKTTKLMYYLIVYPFPSIQTENALANLSFISFSAAEAPVEACCA